MPASVAAPAAGALTRLVLPRPRPRLLDRPAAAPPALAGLRTTRERPRPRPAAAIRALPPRPIVQVLQITTS